jgi:hypothetical protein
MGADLGLAVSTITVLNLIYEKRRAALRKHGRLGSWIERFYKAVLRICGGTACRIF